MEQITCETFETLVSDWLDDELAAEARPAMAAHGASCATCSVLLADLRRIQAEARQLAPLTPSRDLWEGIEGRIEAPVIPLGDAAPAATAPRRRAPRTWQVAPRWLAAAAAVLIAVSSGLTYLATRTTPPPGETGTWVIAGAFDPEAVYPASMTTTTPAEAAAQRDRTDREIAELRELIADRRSQLDSATVATIERSLRVIDEAIAESRAALSRDPANAFLNEQLDETLQRKVELMRALAAAPARS